MKKADIKNKNSTNNNFYKDRVSCGVALWFTGLPSSGKTTIANQLSIILNSISVPNVVLDGDEVRPIIAEGVDFSEEGRFKSLLKYINLSKILIRAKIVTMFVVNNHSQEQRELARKAHPISQFVEIFVDTPLSVCMKRDVKGLYEKARKGEINNLAGISFPYDRPKNSEITLSTEDTTANEAAQKILQYLKDKNFII